MKKKSINYLILVLLVFFATMLIGSQMEMNLSKNIGISIATSFVTIAIFVIYSSIQYNKKLNRIQNILVLDKNPNKFFIEAKALLEETENTSYKAMINIMISNGYSSIHNFKSAYDTLKTIDIDSVHLVESSKQQYYLNLVYFCYVLKKYDEGNKIFEKEQKRLFQAKNNTELKPFATMVDVYHLIATKKFIEAKAEIRRIKASTNNKALIKDLDSLGMMIVERKET